MTETKTYTFKFEWTGPMIKEPVTDSVTITDTNFQVARARAICAIDEKIKQVEFCITQISDNTGEEYTPY